MGSSTSIPGVRNVFAANRKGLVPGPTAVAGKFLRDDGTWSQLPLNMLGGVAGASVPATATTAGDFYIITSAGTSQTKTWAVGDWAIYNGSSGSWTQITGFPSFASDAEARAGVLTNKALTPASAASAILNSVHTRQVRDTLFSDGVTSNRRLEVTPGAAGAIAGMPACFLLELNVPTTNPSSSWVTHLGASGTATGAANNFEVLPVSSAGSLIVRQFGATASDHRTLTYAGFRAAYSGLSVKLAVNFESGDTTTAPQIYAEGVDITASFTLTSSTPPNWMPTTLVTTKFVTGTNSSGRFRPALLILGSLTAAEVLAWTQTGRLPTWCELGTGNAATVYTSSFSAGIDGWTATSVTADGNIDGITDGATSLDDVLRLTTNGGGSPRVSRTPPLTIGRKYRVRFRAYVPAANGTQNGLTLRDTTGGNLYATFSALTTWTWCEIVFVATNTSLVITGNPTTASTGDLMYIRDFTCTELGPIFKPVIQPIAVLADTGTNKIAGVLTSGITPITEKREWVIQARTTTNGNEQLLGAAVFFDSTRHIFDDWVMNTTGTDTASAGSSSGSAAYKASGALAATRNVVSLVTRVPATTALWCASNGTTPIQHTVTGHVVDLTT